MGLGWLPMQLRPAICSKTLRYEATSYRTVAQRRLQELGPGATVAWLELRGGRVRGREIKWTVSAD